MTAPTLAVFPRRKTGQTKKVGPRTPVVITLDILKSCFHLPMPTASAQLGICTTAIKKLCRKFGIKKWPYRTLMSTSRRSKTSNFEDLMTAIEKNTLKNDPSADPVKTAQEIRKNFSLEIMQNKAKHEETMKRESSNGDSQDMKAVFDSGVHALLNASKEAGLENGAGHDGITISEAPEDTRGNSAFFADQRRNVPDSATMAQASEAEKQMLMQQAFLAKQLPQLQLQQLAQLQQLQSLQQALALQALTQPAGGLQLGALNEQIMRGGLPGAMPGAMPAAGLDPNALALAQAQLQAAAMQQLSGMPQMIVH